MARELPIGEVARRAQIPATTIRYYEQIGLLPAPRRSGGQRRYTPAILRRLAIIRYAQAAGLSLSEIRAWFTDFASIDSAAQRWQSLGAQKLPEIEAEIARLQATRAALLLLMTCQCPTVEACGAAMLEGAC